MIFRVIWLAVCLSFLSVQVAQGDDGFEARYAIASEHAKVWINLSPKGPDWVLREPVRKEQMDHLRAKCGNVVDRRKTEIMSILTGWVRETFEQVEGTIARSLADHFTMDELEKFSFADPDAPTVLQIVGQKRTDAFLEAHGERLQAMKREKWVIWKHDFAPAKRAIDPCLARNYRTFTRS